jgi:hypothetical protein
MAPGKTANLSPDRQSYNPRFVIGAAGIVIGAPSDPSNSAI